MGQGIRSARIIHHEDSESEGALQAMYGRTADGGQFRAHGPPAILLVSVVVSGLRCPYTRGRSRQWGSLRCGGREFFCRVSEFGC